MGTEAPPASDDGAAGRLRAAAAANLAAWHDSSVRALGWRPTRTDRWWTCPTPAPNIYHTAVSLRPAHGRLDRHATRRELHRHLDDPDNRHVSVCDSWDELDLGRLDLTRRNEGVWCARPPAPLAVDDGSRAEGGAPLQIERVEDTAVLQAFEHAVVVGFGARPPVAPFDIHGPAVLDDPAMHLFVGLAEDRAEPVAVSMAFVSDGVVGIYGVATIPAARGRGHATALTRRAIEVAPELPAVLQPSPAAHALYRRLGFVDVGTFSHWT